VTTTTGGPAEISGAKRRIVDRLKRSDGATAPEMATEFGLTDTAVRQHLEALEAAGLVVRSASTPTAAAGRGRPPVLWCATPLVDTLFADRHGDLTVELIASIREALGDEALATVVRARARRQLVAYQHELPATGDPATTVTALAQLRSHEGYLAEVTYEADGTLHLLEHHCPIRNAADHCSHLCDAELELFRDVLGPEAEVHRDQHLIAGDARCAYRIELVSKP
jgi:predicted ArsR family transcriptional regulator